MELEPRAPLWLELQRLCGVLDRLRSVSLMYAERYRSHASAMGTYGEKLVRMADKLEYIAQLAVRLSGEVCTGEPGLASLSKAYMLLQRGYERALFEDPPLPARVKVLFYEAYSSLRRVVEA